MPLCTAESILQGDTSMHFTEYENGDIYGFLKSVSLIDLGLKILTAMRI
jgi:hypothetical protein